MGWFLAQSIVVLLLAFALGLVVAWLWWGRPSLAPGSVRARGGAATVTPTEVAAAEETDQALAQRDAARADRDAALAEHRAALSDRDSAVAARDEALAARDGALAERDAALAERDDIIAGQEEVLAAREAALAARESEVQRLRTLTAVGDAEIQRLRALQAAGGGPVPAQAEPAAEGQAGSGSSRAAAAGPSGSTSGGPSGSPTGGPSGGTSGGTAGGASRGPAGTARISAGGTPDLGTAARGDEADDLERIEGVGPRIAHALAAGGITTYRHLADSDVVALQAALEAAGLRFAPSLPTWPEQAALLARGDEAAFAAFTETLVSRRRGEGRT